VTELFYDKLDCLSCKSKIYTKSGNHIDCRRLSL